ncbi:hypothetical protein NDU88_004920, partial [Pleurodeles waltl]
RPQGARTIGNQCTDRERAVQREPMCLQQGSAAIQRHCTSGSLCTQRKAMRPQRVRTVTSWFGSDAFSLPSFPDTRCPAS